MKSGKEVPCFHCGKIHYRFLCQLKNPPYFCCRPCWYTSERKTIDEGSHITFVCPICEGTFWRQRSLIRKGQKQVFCSKPCEVRSNPRRTKSTTGYWLLLVKEHPFATSAGYVPEHRIVVEAIIKRFLEKNEVVHHINERRDDNSPNNLYLFKNNEEHTRYHRLFKYGKVKEITVSNLQSIAIIDK